MSKCLGKTMARKWRRERFNILFYPSISAENELENVVDKDNWSEKLSSVVNSNVCRLKILAAEDDKISRRLISAIVKKIVKNY
jgi:hypothetical protein